MNIGAREQFHHLKQDILQKRKRLFLDVDEVGIDSPIRGHGYRRFHDPELGVRHDRGCGVPWHVDLRHDVDVPVGGVRDEFANLALAVESTVPPWSPGLRINVRGGSRTGGNAPGPHLPSAADNEGSRYASPGRR